MDFFYSVLCLSPLEEKGLHLVHVIRTSDENMRLETVIIKIYSRSPEIDHLKHDDI